MASSVSRVLGCVLVACVAGLGSGCKGPSTLFDPCEGVTCSFYGICITDGIAPYCSCQAGYHPRGLACVANDPDNPCLDVTCNDHGSCRVEGDLPVCDCDPGYAPDTSGLLCLAQPDVDAYVGPDADADGDADAEADHDHDYDHDDAAGEEAGPEGEDEAPGPDADADDGEGPEADADPDGDGDDEPEVPDAADADGDEDVGPEADADADGDEDVGPEADADADGDGDGGDVSDDGGPPPTVEICGNGIDDDGELNPSDGAMVADPPCGSIKWEVDAGGCGHALALSPSGEILALTRPGEAHPNRLVAFDKTGAEQWTFTDTELWGLAVDEAGGIYLVDPPDGEIIGLGPDGGEAWRQTTTSLLHNLVLRDDQIYALEAGGIGVRGTGDGSLVRLLPVSVPSGYVQISWGMTINGIGDVLLPLSQGCETASPASQVLRVRPDGTMAWTSDMPACGWTECAIDEADSWAFSTNTNWAGSQPKDLFYRTSDNEEIWTWHWASSGVVLDVTTVSPLIDMDYVFFGAKTYHGGGSPRSGCATVLERTTGDVVWEDCTRNASYASIIGEGDVLYVSHWSERLTAYDLATGHVRWDKTFTAPARYVGEKAMVLDEDGTLYVIHTSGWGSGCTETLYAVWTESIGGLKHDAPWPKYGHDNRNTSAAPSVVPTVLDEYPLAMGVDLGAPIDLSEVAALGYTDYSATADQATWTRTGAEYAAGYGDGCGALMDAAMEVRFAATPPGRLWVGFRHASTTQLLAAATAVYATFLGDTPAFERWLSTPWTTITPLGMGYNPRYVLNLTHRTSRLHFTLYSQATVLFDAGAVSGTVPTPEGLMSLPVTVVNRLGSPVVALHGMVGRWNHPTDATRMAAFNAKYWPGTSTTGLGTRSFRVTATGCTAAWEQYLVATDNGNSGMITAEGATVASRSTSGQSYSVGTTCPDGDGTSVVLTVNKSDFSQCEAVFDAAYLATDATAVDHVQSPAVGPVAPPERFVIPVGVSRWFWTGDPPVADFPPGPIGTMGLTPEPLDGKLYVLGGQDGTEPFLDTIYAFDVASGVWSRMGATLPYGMEVFPHHTAAIGANGKIYLTPALGPTVAGGWGSHNKIVEYDPVADAARETAAAYPHSRIWGIAICTASTGAIYTFGGHTGSDTDGIYRLDPVGETLVRVATLAMGATNAPVCIAMPDGKIYVAAWKYPSTVVKLEVFDPSTETSELMSYTFNLSAVAGGLSFPAFARRGGVVYLKDSTVDGGELYEWDTVHGTVGLSTWDVDLPRGGFGTAVADGYVYVLGGYASGTYLSTLAVHRLP